MRTSLKRSAAVVGAGVLVLGVSGVAFAFWTTDGTGTGSATTGVATKVSVKGDVPKAMFPGDSAQTITATVTNDGAIAPGTERANANVTTLKAYLTIAPVTAGADCDSTDYLINGVAAAGTATSAQTINVTAKDLKSLESTTGSYTIQFNNKVDKNQNACQGAAVTVNYIAG